MTKMVVTGGTGPIGSGPVVRLAEHGHEGVATAPNTGVNTLIDEGLIASTSGQVHQEVGDREGSTGWIGMLLALTDAPNVAQ